MPYFFQFSKNGRKNTWDRQQKKKTYAKPNGSTMNRICRRFETIGNIRMNYAGVAPFNWQMLLREPCVGTYEEAVVTFCSMDDSNFANIISGKDCAALEEKDEAFGYDLLRDAIEEELIRVCGSAEVAYPYIVKHLFAGEGADKPSHKQMFWRLYGDLAEEILIENLAHCQTCPQCGMRLPAWSTNHQCKKTGVGLLTCVDCGALVCRTNSKQIRCPDCQAKYRATYIKTFKRAKKSQ